MVYKFNYRKSKGLTIKICLHIFSFNDIINNFVGFTPLYNSKNKNHYPRPSRNGRNGDNRWSFDGLLSCNMKAKLSYYPDGIQIPLS